MTFSNSTIIGLIFERDTFNDSAFLRAAGTIYATGPMDNGDRMTLDLTPGANTFTWDIGLGGGLDQARVITSCGL